MGSEMCIRDRNTIKYVVVNLREFELLTLDGLDSLETYFAGVKERGYQRVDYININIIAKNMFEKVWKNSDVEVNFYKDTDSYLLVHPNDSYIKQNW